MMEDFYYYGFSTNNDTLLSSTSGGFAISLYSKYLKENGIVYGVAWSKDFYSAEYIRISNSNSSELFRLQGTKYIRATVKMSDGQSVFDWVIDDLLSQHKVLFIGLPCEVAGLKKMIKNHQISNKNLLTVDLICHGPTKSEVLKQFSKQIEDKYGSKIKAIDLRYKNPDWTESCVRVDLVNGATFLRKLHETDFGIAFNIMGIEGCYNCKFRDPHHESDMTIGDYWGAKPDCYGYNKSGLSLIITHTEKAVREIESMSNFSFYQIIDKGIALTGNPYYSKQRLKDPRRTKFIDLYEKYGLRKACIYTIGIKDNIRVYHPHIHNFFKIIKKCLR